jgi:MFS family permease
VTARLGRTRRETHRSARVLAGCVVGFTGTWNVANIGALATGLARHYGTSLGPIGLFTAANFLGELISVAPAGALIDRFGAKRVGLAGLAICAAGNAVLLAPVGVVLAIVVRWIIGLGVGVAFIAGSAYVRTAENSSLVQGLYGGASLSAGGFALAVIPQLSGPTGWRAPYLSGLALALAGMAFVSASPGTAPGERSGSPIALVKVALDARLARLGMLSAAGFGTSVVIGNWAPTLLARAHGYDKGTAGVVAALTVLLGIVGRPAGGAVARRLPGEIGTVIAAAFAVGACATALLALGGPLALLVPAAALIGVAAGIPFGPAMSAAARAYPQAPGAAIGAMNTYPALAIVVVTPLIGLTFALPGDGRIGFLMLAGIWALAALTVPRSDLSVCP